MTHRTVHAMGHSFNRDPGPTCAGCDTSWHRHQEQRRPCPNPSGARAYTEEEQAADRRRSNAARCQRRRKKKHAQNVARNRHAVAMHMEGSTDG